MWGYLESVSIAMFKSTQDGRDHDAQIKCEGPVAQVEEVVVYTALHFFDSIRFATKPVDLGPAGNAGFDPIALDVVVDDRLIQRVVLDRVGTRADHGHVAAQHIEELRQFVEAGSA
jgi:hypothetical protein